MSKLYSSVSGLSILMALVLALGEWYFFFYGGTWEGPFVAPKGSPPAERTQFT
jgi:hypothetical protein